MGADLICPTGVREASVGDDDVDMAATEWEEPSGPLLEVWPCKSETL